MVAAQYRRMVTKFKQIFSARPHHPPYHHVCQIGDPVLRQKCEYIPIEEIQTPFIEMVSQCDIPFTLINLGDMFLFLRLTGRKVIYFITMHPQFVLR